MATHSLQSKSTVFPYNSRDVEDQQTTSVDSSVIIKGSSSNYRIEKDEEKKKEARKTRYLACCDFSCSNILNAVAVFCAIATCFYSYLYSGGVTKIELVHPIQDRIVSLNYTLYSSEIAEHPNIIPNDEYSNIFSKTLTLMHNCKLHMKGFHGESGIGKTTMLKDSIRLLNPHPYMLISLSETTTIAEIAAQLNMLEKETSWSDIEFTVKKYIDLHSKNLRSFCPLFIIDNANRNAPIANRFISMVREFPTGRIGLLVISSDGYAKELQSAGDRLRSVELFEPSRDFGVKYLQALNITDTYEIDRILLVTGMKPVYLGYVLETVKSDGSVDIEQLQGSINDLILKKIDNLDSTIRSIVLEWAKKLIETPFEHLMLPLDFQTELSEVIYKSNIIRKGLYKDDPYRLSFQNRIVQQFFEQWFNVTKNVTR